MKWLWDKAITNIFGYILLKSDSNSDIVDLDSSFRNACYQGHVEIMEWLYDLGYLYKCPINLHNKDECFYRACRDNNLVIAKWLYYKAKSIGISYSNIHNIYFNYLIQK